MALTLSLFCSMAIFQFKQFSVAQDRCGMKISSVACVFAALIAPKSFRSLLDIGTGTGVLSLMIAQQNTANIQAIEMETEAFWQAKENFENSKWHAQLKITQANAIDWAQATTEKYDCIICNPPFFKGQTNAQDFQRNLARHSEMLDAKALAKISEKCLLTEGQAHFLLANGYEKEYLLAFENVGFHLIESMQIFAHHLKKMPFCHILSFSKLPKSLVSSRFDMQDENFEMHPRYKELMKEYLIIF